MSSALALRLITGLRHASVHWPQERSRPPPRQGTKEEAQEGQPCLQAAEPFSGSIGYGLGCRAHPLSWRDPLPRQPVGAAALCPSQTENRPSAGGRPLAGGPAGPCKELGNL